MWISTFNYLCLLDISSIHHSYLISSMIPPTSFGGREKADNVPD